MKVYKFELKEMPFDIHVSVLKYADLLKMLLMNPEHGTNGIRKKEMKMRIESIRKLDKAVSDGFVLFAPSEMDFIRRLANNYYWGSCTEQLYGFLDALDTCPMIDLDNGESNGKMGELVELGQVSNQED